MQEDAIIPPLDISTEHNSRSGFNASKVGVLSWRSIVSVTAHAGIRYMTIFVVCDDERTSCRTSCPKSVQACAVSEIDAGRVTESASLLLY